MNVKIMNDSMGILQHNEQKAITRVKTKVVVEWDWFQQIAKWQPKVRKPSLLKLAFKQLLKILGVLTWCMGIIIMNEKGWRPRWFNHLLQIYLCKEDKGGMGCHLMGTRVHQKHPIRRDASYLQLPYIGNGPWAIHVQTFLLVWFMLKV